MDGSDVRECALASVRARGQLLHKREYVLVILGTYVSYDTYAREYTRVAAGGLPGFGDRSACYRVGNPPALLVGGFVKHTYVRISWRMTYLIATTNLSDTYVSRSAETHHPLKLDCGWARKYVRKKRTFARCRTGMHFAVVKESSSPADDPLKVDGPASGWL